MCVRLFGKRKRREQAGSLQLLIQAFIVVFACMVITQAQRPGPGQPLRDVVRSIERKELDRLLLLKPLPASKDDSARRAVLKQISEDFRELQALNNRMMAEAWTRTELDYGYISNMVSQIRGKATRLKSNLALPEAPNDEPKDPEFSDAGTFKAGLLLLDLRMMSFVTNPLFQKTNVVEVDLANQASRDLRAVLELSGKLKKTATRISKSARASQ